MKKIGVFIGRFQPFHNGHKKVVEEALKEVDKLIIIVGSSYNFKTFKDPFSYTTRKDLIENSILDLDNSKVEIHPTEDYEKDIDWVNSISRIVINALENEKDYEITLYGFKKDNSSYYLDLFPGWRFKEIKSGIELNSTDTRKIVFNPLSDFSDLVGTVSPYTRSFLDKFILQDEWNLLKDEYLNNVEFKNKWTNTPHEVQFITVDALIISDGHIIMIERDQYPCKGALSLIGGFAKPTERLLPGSMRIVKEKTGINLSKINMTNQCYQDKPNRSLRGRTLTHAFLFEVPYSLKEWKGVLNIPINIIEQYKHLMYEDHYFIIKKLLGGR